MLAATAEHVAFLNSTTAAVSIPLFTITLRDKTTVYRWARYHENVVIGGVTWLAHNKSGRPLIMAQRFRATTGLEEIGECTVELGCDVSTVLGSEPFASAVRRGALEGATLLFERADRATPAAVVAGKRFRFSGKIVQAPVTSHGVTLSVQSKAAELQNTELPKAPVSKECSNAFGDEACGYTRAPTAATVGSGSTKTTIVLTGSWADGHWDLGTLDVTSGALIGESSGVRASVGGTIELTTPLSSAPIAGVTVALRVGCDHTPGEKGCARFSNLPRFRAMPTLPKEA
jgi:hypothetical protein